MVNRIRAIGGGLILTIFIIATWNSYPFWLAILFLVGGLLALGTAIFKQDWSE